MAPKPSLVGPMSKSAFAAAMGVDRAQPTRWAQRGMPVLPDGRVDAAKAAAWVRDNVDPGARSMRRPAARTSPATEAQRPPPPPPGEVSTWHEGQPHGGELLRRQRGEPSEGEANANAKLIANRARIAGEQALKLARANALDAGDLVRASPMTAALVGFVETSKARLLRVPAKVAKGDAKLKAAIEDAITEALEDLSLTRIEEQAGGGFDTEEDEDAEPDEG